MTVSGIFICVCLTVLILAGGIYAASLANDDRSFIGIVLSIVVSIVLCISIWAFSIWWFGSTEKGKRALKTQDSNLNGGIERVVTVYDINGNEIQQYQGQFDIEYADERILFDDEDGNRHIIYFKTGTVIVDEVSNEATT